jgi:hypothetical protein
MQWYRICYPARAAIVALLQYVKKGMQMSESYEYNKEHKSSPFFP